MIDPTKQPAQCRHTIALPTDLDDKLTRLMRRSRRSRSAVIQALLDMIAEDALDPRGAHGKDNPPSQ